MMICVGIGGFLSFLKLYSVVAEELQVAVHFIHLCPEAAIEHVENRLSVAHKLSKTSLLIADSSYTQTHTNYACAS